MHEHFFDIIHYRIIVSFITKDIESQKFVSFCISGCYTINVQTIEGVSKIPIPQEQTYFPRIARGELNLADSLNGIH